MPSRRGGPECSRPTRGDENPFGRRASDLSPRVMATKKVVVVVVLVFETLYFAGEIILFGASTHC